MAKTRRILLKILKILGKIILGILILLLILVLFVRSPWGQDFIKNRLISNIEKKTDAKIDLDRIFIEFDGDISIEGLYIEEPDGDTLVYAKNISAAIPFWPIIKGNSFSLNELQANTLKARIIRQDSINGFNYEFLLNAFGSADTTQTAPTTDTTSAPMEINIGDINLNDFDILYQDAVTGIDASIKFNSLEIGLTETDLQEMIFRADQAVLSDAQIDYTQTKAVPPSDSLPPPEPIISVNDLKLKQISGSYRSKPDSLDTEFQIADFQLENSEMDMKKLAITSEGITLKNSDIGIRMQQPEVAQQSKEPSETTEFEWPGWNIKIDRINLEDNSFDYFVNNAEVKKGVFDPNAISLDSLIFKANQFAYQKEEARLNIEAIKFKEGSGIELDRFDLQALLTDKKLQVDQIGIALNQNRLSGSIGLDYKSINELINQPGEVRMNANISILNILVSDLYRFQPSLEENQYLDSLAGYPVKANLRLSGTLNDLSIDDLDLAWNDTRISGTGKLYDLQDPESLVYDLSSATVKTQKSDVLNFVKEADLGIKLPQEIKLTGSFSGSSSRLKTNSELITSDGALNITGEFDFADAIAFDAEIKGDSIALGELLQNEALGEIGLSLSLKGSGSGVNDLDANLQSNITSFTYNDYEFKDISITGELEDGKGPVNLTYKDQNLNMQASSVLELDTVSTRIDFDLDLEGADLGALNVTQRNIRTGFQLDGWFRSLPDGYEAEAEIRDGVAVYNNESYLLGNLDASAYVRPDTTSIQVSNRALKLDLQSNADPAAFTAAINRHFRRYITEGVVEDTVTNPVNLKLEAHIVETPILNEVFLVNLQEMDSIDIDMNFSEEERRLDAMVSIPYINYFNSEIDSLEVEMESNEKDLNFEFGFKSLDAGPLAIKKTRFSGRVIDQKLDLDFASSFEEDSLVFVQSQLNFKGDTLKFHIKPEKLILNRNPWQIASSNQVSYSEGYLNFEDFILSRNQQQMRITNDLTGVEKEHLGMDFENFNLAALLTYLNPENELATGQLNGRLVYEDPFGKSGILANLNVNQLQVLGVDLNRMDIKGNSTGFNEYDFEMAVKGGEVDLDLTGSYTAAEPSADLDLNLDLNEVKMSAVEGFSQGELTNTSGSFSGNFSITGNVTEPQYQGELNFDQAKFNIAYVNATFTLPDEQLRLENDAVYFNSFRIQDARNNAFVVNGEVDTENLLNPGFDLDLEAQDFKLLSSTKEDNELFYGEAVIDVDAQITGDLNLPVVDGSVTIKKETKFFYVIPENEIQMEERDGVVIFVNKENPDDILSQPQEESYTVSGYDISARINVKEGAEFNVILNEDTGDQFQVKGEGDLLFDMYPNGRISLTGVYEINDGFYRMSLYNLVERRFDIADGSRVSWSGDPFNAQLDVRAIYEVEASASALMASQISGVNQDLERQYRQELPFFVYLNVDGELTEPKLTFNLDMPEDEQGAVNGQVYGRIQQLNNQEQELNKQVFSLLVLNRFFPESGSTGASGGTLAVARDNLNDALSDQLNMLSSRILGESGVQLNFELDSFTDYQGNTPEDRTQLDINAQKAFMEDRLIVEVGSEVDIQGGNQPGQQGTPLIGNVSIAYLLDPNGTWRLKGFNRSQFENVIDGQIIVSGIALIFTKEFNEFKNIFEKAVADEVKKQENETKENQSEDEK
ncbi:translocation/assembly module TamB domain-containing protein [Gramella sp. GC03-9]|uniref:Translocation/assembly module TamB domain-containing protein n=1 Tax=Christiangramia oceanisediminis TaxID=2920386 RepID=A0A9X2KY08_9FLAO|nr:translocation/assembly module TamB domain-containing protein [Gramella oceanisediminis]MCP9200390.1 translocation/assembly module TamB domain-containing protein [Gramella oceanisediminis]